MGIGETLGWIGGIFTALVTAGLGLYYFSTNRNDGKKSKKTNEDLGDLAYIEKRMQLSDELNMQNEIKMLEKIQELKDHILKIEEDFRLHREQAKADKVLLRKCLEALKKNNIKIPE